MHVCSSVLFPHAAAADHDVVDDVNDAEKLKVCDGKIGIHEIPKMIVALS